MLLEDVLPHLFIQVLLAPRHDDLQEVRKKQSGLDSATLRFYYVKWLQIDPKSIVRGGEVYSTRTELLNPPPQRHKFEGGAGGAAGVVSIPQVVVSLVTWWWW